MYAIIDKPCVTIPCPTCDAPAGRICRSVTGHGRIPHPARRQEFRELHPDLQERLEIFRTWCEGRS